MDPKNDFLRDVSQEDFLMTLDEVSVHRAQIPEKHLDSPIMISLLERLQTLMNNVLQANKDLKPAESDARRIQCIVKYLNENPMEAYSSIKKPLLQYSDMLDYCIKPPEILDAYCYPYLFSIGSLKPYRLHTDYKLARRIFEREIEAYTSQLSDILKPDEIIKFKGRYTFDTTLWSTVVDSASQSQLWSDIVERYRREYGNKRQRKRHEIGPVRFVCGDGFLIIKTDELKRWKLLTYEQLQMIQDCCLARHNVQLSLQFGFHNGNESLTKHVQRVQSWQEEVLTTYGNTGYELVKAPEAIFKAWLNSLTDGDLLTYSSYDRTLDKMSLKESKLDSTSPLIKKLDRIVRSVSSIFDAAELFGLSKLSGHPTVYAKKSIMSVREEAEPVGTILPYAVRQLERMFKHMTLSGYLSENQSWPPFLCPPALGTELRRHWTNRVTSLPMGSYPLSDLDAIIFKKFVEYDYSEDYLKFLDDKAICPGAREMSKFWFPGSREEPRRLLDKILKMEHFDTYEMVERLRRGKFSEDEYVVELTQKERELKVAARCFCKLPFEVRTFFTSTEYNLKEQFMKKYIPQQTMTMSNNDTKMRMHNLVKDAKNRNRTLLEVDFSRWNLRWRNSTVQGIAGILEDIFGLKGVFSQAHPFFKKATIVMTDKHTLPEFADPDKPITQWRESEMVYRNKHLGGFEGIQQALWTICTVAMMYWVLYDQSVSFMMAGQGDNQIFALTFNSTTKGSADQLRELLAIMETRCQFLNHEVKPDECIDSSTVLTYSKDIYVEGNHILYNLKFSSRTFKRDEIDMPSLSTEIASISACSMACADSVYDTPKAIFWKTFQTLRFLSQRYRSENYRIEHSALNELLSDESKLTFSLLLPGSLGGFPTMSWTRFFMKGEVDDLSWDVPAVRALGKNFKPLLTDLVNVMHGKFTPKRLDLTQLILDPNSIPIERPRDLKRLVKDAVASALPEITNNKWIANIFNSSATDAGDDLLQQLTTSRPFYPKIMSDIYSLSPSGVRDALLSRFTMTRTINTITGNPNFSTEISIANANLIRFILKRYKLALESKSVNCLPRTSYDTCKSLRSLWGEEVQHSCIGVYNPFDFPLKYTNLSLPMISASSRCRGDKLTTEIGPYPPNFGTKTRAKVSDHGFKIVTSSSTVADLKTLVLTASELGLDNSLLEVLSSISKARSPWNVSTLLPILPTAYGGTAAHRHQDINRSAFSLLGSRTVPTHLNFCSDNAGVLSGGEYDYPFAFQEFYLVLTNLYQVLSHASLLCPNASIGFHMTDEYEPLPDDPVTISDRKPIKWQMLPSNKLVYVSSLMVKELPTVPPTDVIPHIEVDKLDPVHISYNYFLIFILRKQRALINTSIVNYPLDILDMKEFNHGRLNDFEVALVLAIQAVALSITIQHHTRDAHVFFKAYLMKICRGVAGPFARLFTHTMSQANDFVLAKNVFLQPGASGAVAAADHYAGYLYERTLLSIRSRELLLRSPPVILFADYQRVAYRQAEATWISSLALCSSDLDKVMLSSYQRLSLASINHAMFSNTNTLVKLYHLQSVTSSLLENRFSNYEEKNRPAYSTYSPQLVYCSTVVNEAIRALRRLPPELRSQRTDIQGPSLLRVIKPGLRTIKRSTREGHLAPGHVCSPPSLDQRIVESFVTKLKRPFGMISTAVDLWLTCFSQFKKELTGSHVISIGVGHGAVARSALLSGATEVSGIDLRSSFPIVTQREATYVPPEILTSGLRHKFSWHPHVSTMGGDILQMTPELKESIQSTPIVVLDVELDLQTLLPVLPAIRGSLLTFYRLFGCDEWMQYICDMTGSELVYSTDEGSSTHKKMNILVSRTSVPSTTLPNYLRIRFVETRPFKTATPKSGKRLVEIFNYHLQSLGESLKLVSPKEVETLAAALRTRSNNSVDDATRDALQAQATSLLLMVQCFRQYETLTLNQLKELQPTHRRLLAQWLANSALPLQPLVSSLLLQV